MQLNEAIQIMSSEIVSILADNGPTIYIFGSVTLDDFKLGWSDIDIVVLTKNEISQSQADILVSLRQKMLERFPENPYFRLFEGGMISEDAFLNGKDERTVYWGTSGQRIADNYRLDSFALAELLDSGILLHGNDIRPNMSYPRYSQMRDDIANHLRTIRKYGIGGSWILDIARGIYTLRTGKIISKTAAGEWALKNGLCPDREEMLKVVQIRKEPQKYSKGERSEDSAVIQRFADVLDDEFTKTVQRFAESELALMNIQYTSLLLIQNKDGVSVWRVIADNLSCVMKCFDNADYRREIENYQTLISLGVPTLEVIASTDCSILIEDIEHSK